jgi:microcystin-dependent protein
MSEPFLCEIRLMSFDFAPKGWAQCNGQFLPINQNQPLFSLLGTTYGGDGQNNFALPDLRGRVPIHFVPPNGSPFLGERAGSYSHTLTQQEMPAHTHAGAASSSATGGNSQPALRFLGGANNAYRSAASLTSMHPQTVTNVGGSQSHSNTQPYLVLNFCIALQGIFPSRN